MGFFNKKSKSTEDDISLIESIKQFIYNLKISNKDFLNGLEDEKKMQYFLLRKVFILFFIPFCILAICGILFDFLVYVLCGIGIIALVSLVLYFFPPKKISFNKIFLVPVMAALFALVFSFIGNYSLKKI